VSNTSRKHPILMAGASLRRKDGQKENVVRKAEAEPSVDAMVRAEVVVQLHSTPL
jgi:hypothetical protein